MDTSTIQKTVQDMQALIDLTVSLYDSYFQALEAVAQRIPDSEVEKQREIASLIQEVKVAMEADMTLFDKVLASDSENIKKIPEKLEIQEIHNMLNNTK